MQKFKLHSSAVLAAILLLAAGLSSCGSSSIEQVNKIKKPAVVYSKHKSEAWYENPTMSLKDADGEIIELSSDDAIRGLIDKYQVGDTLK